MQVIIQYPNGGPVIVYNTGPGHGGGIPGTFGPGSTMPNQPSTSGQGPIITPDTDLGGLLSRDPNRSVGDAPLHGANDSRVYGRLPQLGRPAPAENVFERVQRGLFSLLKYGPEVAQSYLDFMDRNYAGQERKWFSLNAGTWPVIKVNGAQKFAAARSMTSMIGVATAEIGPKRKFNEERIRTLRELEAQLESDLYWQAGDWAAARNVLAGAVNGLASTGLGVLSALGPPQGLVFNVFYDSMDEVFREGAYFNPEAWRDAFTRALIEAAAVDMFTRGNVLKALLLEFSKLAQRLLEIQDNENARRELRREIQRQLDLIGQEMEKYQESYRTPQLLEAVSQELNRQPTYVISVVNDYERYTGIKVALGIIPDTRGAPMPMPLVAAMLPMSLLLGIRSREVRVRLAEDQSHAHQLPASAVKRGV